MEHPPPGETLTGSVSPMVTCSEKRTFTGLDRSFAFLAALIKADLGDCEEKRRPMSSAQPKKPTSQESFLGLDPLPARSGSGGPRALARLLEARLDLATLLSKG